MLRPGGSLEHKADYDPGYHRDMEEAGEIPKRTDQWLAAEQHTFLCESGGDTRGTSWTPCFIRNQVKYR